MVTDSLIHTATDTTLLINTAIDSSLVVMKPIIVNQWENSLQYGNTLVPSDSIVQVYSGIEGNLRIASFFHSDMIIAILLSLLVLLSLVITFSRKAKVHYFASIFIHPMAGTQTTRITVLEEWKQVLYGAFSLIGYSGFALYLLVSEEFGGETYSIWQLYGYVAMMVLIYFGTKYILMRLYVYTFFTPAHTIVIRQYFAILFYTGIIAFLFLFAIVFSPSYLHQYLLYSLGIVTVLSLLLMFYVLYTNFFNKIHLIFYFILYLCTLEILPLLVLLKMLERDLYFIN